MIQVRFKGAEYHLRACISDAHLKDLLALQYLWARSFAKAIEMKSECVLDSFDS